MKNKFEALTAFQSWPEDWQRLCAEYWAENDRPKNQEMFRATVVDESSTILAKPCKVFRRKQGKNVSNAAKSDRSCKPFTKEEYDHATQKPSFVNDTQYAEHLAEKFGRTVKAFQNYLSLIRKGQIDSKTGQKTPSIQPTKEN